MPGIKIKEEFIMIINHNMGALNANRNMNINATNASKSMEKLSSGLRINKAGDDAAGLAISEKMRGQIRGLDQASANAQDGISMVQTAEGALGETTSILQRMRELSVQSSSDTNTTVDRTAIQKEVNALTSEINRIGNTTEFNTLKLINGDKTQVTTGAVIGTKTLTVDILTSGAISVSGISVANVGSANSATSIAATINADVNLSANYTATVSGADGLIITQNTGSTADTAVIAGAGVTASASVTVGVSGTVTDGRATLQIGANTDQTFSVDISDMRSTALSLSVASGSTDAAFATGATNQLSDKSGTANEYALDLSTSAKATAAITTIDAAINTVSAERAKLGAYSNRLEHTIANLGTTSENMTSAESRIRDVDMAKEMSTFSKNNILSQAAQAMLAQANQQPQQVLQLLR